MVEKTKITFENVSFWYGEKQILFNLNLKIFENKITSLIGPSGCGKSTLLRTINRMNDIIKGTKIEGKVNYKEEDIYSSETDIIELRRKVGMVFQKPNPFPMSIFENVAYGLKLRETNKEEIEKIVIESLKKADLFEEVKDRLNASAFSLSGGQQQRLCIARALAINPEVILLDEPCSALDPISTSKIESLLRKLKSEHTIVIVTHNMHQAKRVSDYSCYLLNGEIIEFGKTSSVFEKPKKKSTEEYVNGEFG